jgi:hypothetical protein
MEELLFAYGRQIECRGEHKIEVEESKRWYQEIFFVDLAEVDRFDTFPFHQTSPDQYKSEQ